MDNRPGPSGVVSTADFERWGPGEERIGSPQEGIRAKQERLSSHLDRMVQVEGLSEQEMSDRKEHRECCCECLSLVEFDVVGCLYSVY